MTPAEQCHGARSPLHTGPMRVCPTTCARWAWEVDGIEPAMERVDGRWQCRNLVPKDNARAFGGDMTHRDPQVHLDRSEARCTQDGWCRDNPSGCARYMAPIVPGSPVEDFSLPPSWMLNRAPVMQCPKRLAIGSRQQPAAEQPRRVHPPLGSEQC